jgi:CRISPR-associated protein Csb2
MLVLAWEYLTGRAVAADLAYRTKPEWPPHPDRVFQALVASWGERGCAADERAALAWLEERGAPDLVVPDDDLVSHPPAPKVYVPVNDTEGRKRGAYKDGELALLPSNRARKERYFPSTLVGSETCALVWREADPGAHRPALERLAAGVNRIGHSSSLVRLGLASEAPRPRWSPTGDRRRAELWLRVPEAGRLSLLVQHYADGGADHRRPSTGAWCGYAPFDDEPVHEGVLSGRVLMLRRVAGAPLHLGQTLALTRALRAALLRHASGRALELLSGHAADGAPLTEAHAAFVPLGFVGTEHADGHLLGFAVVLPRQASYADEEAVMDAFARAVDGETEALSLRAPDGREFALALDDRSAPPVALRPSTWTRPSRVWSTATPIVLDRQPPRRHTDREGFAASQIARSCEQMGLPSPAEVRVGNVAHLEGVPASSSFAPLPTKEGRGRWHVHAWIRFESPVRGPVALGAGRYRGYGFCRPVREETGS